MMRLEPQAMKSSRSTGFRADKALLNRNQSVRDSNGILFDKNWKNSAGLQATARKLSNECSQKILLIRSTRLIVFRWLAGLNQMDSPPSVIRI